MGSYTLLDGVVRVENYVPESSDDPLEMFLLDCFGDGFVDAVSENVYRISCFGKCSSSAWDDGIDVLRKSRAKGVLWGVYGDDAEHFCWVFDGEGGAWEEHPSLVWPSIVDEFVVSY